MARARKAPSDRTREAVRRTRQIANARDAARNVGEEPARTSGTSDPFSGGLRRREVLPLLVLHYIADGPCYGNQLMERIASLTEGVLSVNPNTMYPLLRNLEGRGLIAGSWEHPDRRSRRYYSITSAGADEYAKLLEETLPFLGALARSLDGIFGEIYGEG